MKRIGFIGAQSKHTVYFGNILSAGVGGLDSDSGRLWAADAPELILSRQAEGNLSGSCGSLRELIEGSDALMILVRDGKTHRELAERCLNLGKPVFVDKPFACTAQDAAAILAAAEAKSLPIMGGSTLCWLPEIERVSALLPRAKELAISFMADWDSPHGGWYYYGSHLTDLCARLAGTQAEGFEARREGKMVEATVYYDGLTVKLTGAPHIKFPLFSLTYQDGSRETITVPDYERCYRLGMERFSRMLREEKSVHPQELLFSTKLLEGIIKTLSAGQTGRQGL